MRHSLLDPYEDLPRDVVVTSNDYAAEFTFPRHAHRRGQFAFAARGTISVTTPQGRWLVPPQRACWVPAGLAHEMTMRGPVTMLNAFLSVGTAMAVALPMQCRVYAVSPLLRQLLEAAVDLPALYDEDGRAGKLMQLLAAEIASMPALSLHAPLPSDARLARVCRALFDTPSLAARLNDVAADAGMSRRTFTRLFRADTGVSFAEWRQQVCLLAAIERLGQGQAVTRVALDLRYASPSAFSAAFRHALGCSPSRYAES
ncbi:AraC family transcriptional regulator [Stenotrophomonas geniculata]|uniref:AraC family transcriptional regulator n=1 Tax=Stenotrophomonas geniculata TaxID=86188 RepID=UPI00070EA477|nr:helix-turn-helix transcriptional regulator [Stenotrophomonas geniculata]KRG50626.1 AraC family transcriptional regulator [Stenotrophomonas geniculata ATCC 19374 = JCM 13324]